MKYPIYTVFDEPRVRRRLWENEKRARCAAKEALLGEAVVPEKFIVSIAPPHSNNKAAVLGACLTYLVGQLRGQVTSVTTICLTVVSSSSP